MNTPIETIQHNGFTIKIYPDYIDESPREWDNLATFVCYHRRYDLAHEADYNHEDYGCWDEMEADIIKRERPTVIKPIYMYDHGGITINTTGFHCPWDSGQIGFVFVSRSEALKEYGGSRITKKIRERCERVLDCEVKTYDQYLRGDVYGYVVEDDEGNHVDSCWSFYGYDYCVEEAKLACVVEEAA